MPASWSQWCGRNGPTAYHHVVGLDLPLRLVLNDANCQEDLESTKTRNRLPLLERRQLRDILEGDALREGAQPAAIAAAEERRGARVELEVGRWKEDRAEVQRCAQRRSISRVHVPPGPDNNTNTGGTAMSVSPAGSRVCR